MVYTFNWLCINLIALNTKSRCYSNNCNSYLFNIYYLHLHEFFEHRNGLIMNCSRFLLVWIHQFKHGQFAKDLFTLAIMFDEVLVAIYCLSIANWMVQFSWNVRHFLSCTNSSHFLSLSIAIGLFGLMNKSRDLDQGEIKGKYMHLRK